MAPPFSDPASLLPSRDASEGFQLVAVAGIPGSGKSTFGRELVEAVPESILLPMDGYHRPRAELTDAERARRGAPDTFDSAALRRDLGNLRTSGEGRFPSFDHARKDPEPDAIEVEPRHRVVVVEGLYLLLRDWDLESLFDLTIWLDCDLEVAMRRVARRHLEAGICRSEEEARFRVDSNDRRNARLLLADGCRERADRILDTTE